MRIKLLTGIMLVSTTVLSAEFSLLSGSEIDTRSQSYSYIGSLVEQKMNSRGSLLGKAWIDYLTYKFEQGSVEVEAEAPAFQLSAGYRYYFPRWSLTGWLGWERRDTSVSPDTGGIEVKGVEDSLLLQVEVDSWFNNGTNASFITSYSSATSYLWARGRLKKKALSENTRLGVELIGHGNEDYRAVQTGVIGEYYTNRFSAGLRGGYKNSSKGNSLYVGFEVYLGF